MVGFQRPAGDREEAALVFTDSAVQLFPALEAVHVGGRSAHILDIAFESGQMGELFRFLQDGFRAAPAHRPPLVDGDRAEIAFAVTAAMGADRESDRLLQLDGAHLFIEGMLATLERQGVDGVHLGLGGIGRGWILDEEAVPVGLGQPFGGDGIHVAVELVEHADEGQLVRGNLFI